LHEGTRPRISRRKRIALLIILPLALALHAWLIWLGGGWRIFALAEAGIGVFLVLACGTLKR
jgi:hypothetical protein